MQANFKYTACVIEFINCIIKCSIIPEDEAKTPQYNIPSTLLNELDLSFIQKLDVNLNAVARKCQMHSSTHKTTCYKYGAIATN